MCHRSHKNLVEHGLIVRRNHGHSLVGHGIGSFEGQLTQQPVDVLNYLQQVQGEGWQLVAVETAPEDETRYWLTRSRR